MLPKNKAKELIEKYVDIQSDLEETTSFDWEYAIKCALIAVGEIIESHSDNIVINELYYWQEVRKEIEKL
jgi:hypothetical protein